MSERTVVTRRYDFVKKVENTFVKQYCFDSISKKQLFSQNQSETKAKRTTCSPTQVAQNMSISRIITNSALYTGRQWNDVFVSFVMTFSPLDSLL